MWFKFVLFVAAFCVANSSVVINVYDDEPDTSVRRGVEDCNYVACDQLCRRLGFPGGACINGRCKCDNFRDAKEFGSYIEEISAVRNKNCQDQTCNENCKRAGNRAGVCIYNHCKCIPKTYAEEFDSLDTDIVEQLTDVRNKNCQDQTCNENCKKAGNRAGVCIYNRCKCIPKTYAEEFDSLDTDIVEKLTDVRNKNCQDQTCNENCKRAGNRGGVCIYNHCKCIRKYSEDTVSDVADSSLDTPVSKGTCTDRVCDRFCRTLHFKRGSCANGTCKCYRNDTLTTLEDSRSEESTPQQTVADYSEAEESNMIPTEDEKSDELTGDVSSCNPYKCIQSCIISGKHGGYCHHHKCHCF